MFDVVLLSEDDKSTVLCMYLLGGNCIVIPKSTSYFSIAALTGYYSIKKTQIFFLECCVCAFLKDFFCLGDFD